MTTLPLSGSGCCSPCISIRAVTVAAGVAAEGDNYCFSGAAPNQVLKIKNLDTGLSNAVHTVNPDGTQTITLDDGTAC